MAKLSDIIEDFLKEMIVDSKEDIVQIQRNELADKFNCAPSQINYVLTTRFTYERGYIIESRRGGGGCILIKKLGYNMNDTRSELIQNSIGNAITYYNSLALIDTLYETEIISQRELEIIKIVLNERTLINVENKNELRANILKSIINTVIK